MESMADERKDMLKDGIEMYQEHMSNKAVYSVNLFERTPRLNSSEIASEIRDTLPAENASDFLRPPDVLFQTARNHDYSFGGLV